MEKPGNHGIYAAKGMIYFFERNFTDFANAEKITSLPASLLTYYKFLFVQ